jgi:hypothetical protein
MRLYADADAYAAEFPGTAPANLDKLLRNASRAVDVLLVGVLYDTDVDGMPTDDDVAAAMSEATCAIAAEAAALGTLDAGSTQTYESVSIGNVSLQNLQGASDSDSPSVGGMLIPAVALLALNSIGPVRVWVL